MRGVLGKTAVGAALVACCYAAGVPTALGSPQTTSGFVIVSSPTVGSDASLESVAAVSAKDVWTVGSAGQRNLIERWNGSIWAKVAVAHPGASSLRAVSAGGGAVWAVGDRGSGGEAFHLVGSAWKPVGIPSYVELLTAVKVFSNTNVWAGGMDSSDHHVLIHWNGGSWTRIADAHIVGASEDYISAIAGTSTHIFETGESESPGIASGKLAREVTPTSWHVIGSTVGDQGYLPGLSSTSTSNVWAVGSKTNSGGHTNPIAWHWNGQATALVTVPSYTTDHALIAVVAISTTNVWAVGKRAGSAHTATLIDHYTGGSSFADLGGPNVAGVNNVLAAIAEVPGSPGDLWAVGSAGGATLILHHT